MFIRSLIIIGLAVTASLALADGNKHDKASYQVTITNLTPGQTFTPQLVLTHTHSVGLFSLGDAASTELEILAEDGDTGPQTSALEDQAFDITTIGGLIGPGQSATTTVSSARRAYISFAAMLIPTNDTFVALNAVRLPKKGSVTHFVPAYDAGTEFNDQKCLNIPGPRCGGMGYSMIATDKDEGFVHISNGFHDLGAADEDGNEVLSPVIYDWKNSVAKITIKRIH